MEAASGLMNLAMLPMWIVSGVFFSSTRFPHIFQPFIRALPLTAAIDALRANMLQGTSLAHLLNPVITLSVWLVVTFALLSAYSAGAEPATVQASFAKTHSLTAF